MPQFSWVPVYRDVARTLLGYENRQTELAAILRNIASRGLAMISLEDKLAGGKRAPLNEIDPFTFFASFNRGITKQNRRAIIEAVQQALRIPSSPPADFTGIPVAQNMSSWFFPYARDGRSPEDIPSLWRLARGALAGPPNTLDPGLFKRCLSIQTIRVAKLTMGLFWLNPDSYLSLDSVMRKHLRRRSIQVPTVSSLSDYVEA